MKPKHPIAESKVLAAKPGAAAAPEANTMRLCKRCGLNIDLVGVAHRCIPRRMANAAPPVSDVANTATTTYRYRDASKRRTYMRDFMRKQRGDLKRQSDPTRATEN